MSSSSRIKGSGFEREISKYLATLYGENFHRIPNSGAYVGGKNTARKSALDLNQSKGFKGDINAPDSWKYFNAEAKFYSDFQFHQLFTDSRQLETWISQLLTAGDDHDLSVLFMKFNRRGRYLAVQSDLNWNKNCNYFIYQTTQYKNWIIYSFEKFFELNQQQFKHYSTNSIITD